MEAPWDRFDFAIDVSAFYGQKLAALASYRSVFSGGQAELLARYGAGDRYVGSLVGEAMGVSTARPAGAHPAGAGSVAAKQCPWMGEYRREAARSLAKLQGVASQCRRWDSNPHGVAPGRF